MFRVPAKKTHHGISALLSFPNHTKNRSKGQGPSPSRSRPASYKWDRWAHWKGRALNLEHSSWELSQDPDPSSPGNQRGEGRTRPHSLKGQGGGPSSPESPDRPSPPPHIEGKTGSLSLPSSLQNFPQQTEPPASMD